MYFKMYFTYIKTFFRSKEALIWLLAFPLALSTLFSVAFGKLDESYVLEPFGVAVVNGNYDKEFTAALESVSSGDSRIFNKIDADSEEEALKLLEAGEISGYIYSNGGEPAAKVLDEGLNQTILKEFLDSYVQTKAGITRIISADPTNITKIAELLQSKEFTKSIPVSSNEQTEMNTYYYALLAMTCLYGGSLGQSIVNAMQGNLSPLGARKSIAPVSRSKMFLAELAAAVSAHFINLLISLFYMTRVLGLNFGNKTPAIILTCFVGVVVGIAFGAFISSLTKFKEVVKNSIIMSVTMICSFFAGLMISNISYAMKRDFPILHMINPAARIADSFYCLYYYDDYDKYFLNIGILCVMAVFMLVCTMLAVRRQRYESI